MEVLSLYLSKKRGEFERIEVTGHASRVGSYAVNKELSWGRARTVARYFKKQGLSRRLKVNGMSFNTPLDYVRIYREREGDNRRTEIKIIGIENPAKFNGVFKHLAKKYGVYYY